MPMYGARINGLSDLQADTKTKAIATSAKKTSRPMRLCALTSGNHVNQVPSPKQRAGQAPKSSRVSRREEPPLLPKKKSYGEKRGIEPPAMRLRLARST
jgi:hypothetical protein